MTLSRDGRRLFTAPWVGRGAGTARVQCRDLTTGELVWDAGERFQKSYADCTVSPSGDGLATASYDKKVRVFDISTGDCLVECEGHSAGLLKIRG